MLVVIRCLDRRQSIEAGNQDGPARPLTAKHCPAHLPVRHRIGDDLGQYPRQFGAVLMVAVMMFTGTPPILCAATAFVALLLSVRSVQRSGRRLERAF